MHMIRKGQVKSIHHSSALSATGELIGPESKNEIKIARWKYKYPTSCLFTIPIYEPAWLLDIGTSIMPIRALFVGIPHSEHFTFIKRFADDLQADRQAL
jgi:hypothetical protein